MALIKIKCKECGIDLNPHEIQGLNQYCINCIKVKEGIWEGFVTKFIEKALSSKSH